LEMAGLVARPEGGDPARWTVAGFPGSIVLR
jgi:hypothetical protein